MSSLNSYGLPPWLLDRLWPYLEASEYGRAVVAGLLCKGATNRARVWPLLAQRDFPCVNWLELSRKVVYRQPVFFYRVCAGRRACLLCGEGLWSAGNELAYIVVCRCLRLHRYAYPYAHASCLDMCPQQAKRRIPSTRCHICGHDVPAVPIRIYST